MTRWGNVWEVLYCMGGCVFFFFKQKTAYEMRISDWSSDVCSSDLFPLPRDAVGRRAIERERMAAARFRKAAFQFGACAVEEQDADKIGRASCRERVCQYV